MRLLLLHNALMLIYLGSLFLNYPAPADIYTLSLHVALPIWRHWRSGGHVLREVERQISQADQSAVAREYGAPDRSEEHTSELQSLTNLVCRLLLQKKKRLA